MFDLDSEQAFARLGIEHTFVSVTPANYGGGVESEPGGSKS